MVKNLANLGDIPASHPYVHNPDRLIGHVSFHQVILEVRGEEMRKMFEEASFSCLCASLAHNLFFLSSSLPPPLWFSSAGGINALKWDLPFTTPTSCNTAFAIIMADVGPPSVHPQPGVFGHLEI